MICDEYEQVARAADRDAADGCQQMHAASTEGAEQWRAARRASVGEQIGAVAASRPRLRRAERAVATARLPRRRG